MLPTSICRSSSSLRPVKSQFAFAQHRRRPLALGDVLASTHQAHRPSLSILKNLPVLLQDFDAAVCHDNPVFDLGRRTLFERSLKSRIHFRTIVRMNKFDKACTPRVKIGGVSLKYAVCLFGPGYVKTGQLSFPTAYFCHRLGLDQSGAFRLQLLCDPVLLPLAGSEGFFRLFVFGDIPQNAGNAIDSSWTVDRQVGAGEVPDTQSGVLRLAFIADDVAGKALI